MYLAKAWISSFMANSSPVLIKKIPPSPISCWGNSVIMFLNALQLLVISEPILKLFAFLSFCSAWVQQAVCRVQQLKNTFDTQQIHILGGSRIVSLSFHSLPVLTHFFIIKNGKHSIPSLSSSLVFVSWRPSVSRSTLTGRHEKRFSRSLSVMPKVQIIIINLLRLWKHC